MRGLPRKPPADHLHHESHDGHAAAAKQNRVALLARAAQNFGYLAEVQPVFDRQCVACHDYGKDAGKKLNLAGDLNSLFNTSYVELRSKDYVRVIDAGPPEVQMPKSWGSHASRLVSCLLAGHDNPEIDRQVKLTAGRHRPGPDVDRHQCAILPGVCRRGVP